MKHNGILGGLALLALLAGTANVQAQRERIPNDVRPTNPTTPGTPSAEVQKLIDDLKSKSVLDRLRAAKELGKLGGLAKSAVPALENALRDSDQDVREIAANALKSIQNAPPTPGLVPPKTPATTAGKLTPDSLGDVLRELNYDFKTGKFQDTGKAFYTVSVKRGENTFMMEVSLSRNEGNVWIIAPLDKLPSGNWSNQLQKLLEHNWVMAPSFFSINQKYNRVYLQRALENRELSSSMVRAAIERMVDNIGRTIPLWRTSRWGEVDQPRPFNRDAP